jgi:quercetin dioxygenase-like cupin family protein
MKKVWFLVEEESWIPHPTAKGVIIKPLISKKVNGVDLTCMLVKVRKGLEVPEHIHEDQDDILYPLEGKAVMWVDGSGSFPLMPGVIVLVPRGKKHKIADVSDDLLIYDVFYPAFI